jgi:carbonic anhydrase
MAAPALERENAVRQAARLSTYPTVAERVAEGDLAIHAWYYSIGRGAVRRWEAEAGAFVPLPVTARRNTRKRRRPRW